MKHIFIFIFFFSTIISFPQSKKNLHLIPSQNNTKASTKVYSNKVNDKNLNIYIKPSSNSNTFKDILPILTLLLGIFINRSIDFLTDRKRIKKHGERWKIELNSLETPINKQNEIIKTFLIEHEKEKAEVPQMTIYSSLDCKTFDSLDKPELIKYLEKYRSKKYSESIKISNKIQAFISIQKGIFENLNIKFKDYLREISLHTTSLNNNLQELHRIFGDYAVEIDKEIGKSSIHDDRVKPILILFENEIIPYRENALYNIYHIDDKFYKPLIGILTQLRHDDRTKPLITSVRQGMISINYIKNEKYYLKVNLESTITQYTQQAKELEIILKELK